MSSLKLFGTYRGSTRLPKNTRAAAKRRNPLKAVVIVLFCLLMIEACYFICVYSQNAFITKWRTIYIETAMDTLNHKWLATSIIPDDIIQDVMDQRREALEQQMNISSSWEKDESNSLLPEIPPATITPEFPDQPKDPVEFDPNVSYEEETDPEEEARR